jgi:Ca2+:H+ antiporter
VADRGKIRLATEIAVASAAQVAVFLIPAVVLLALFIEPLSLALRQVEILALALSVVVTAIVLANGQSSRLKGGILVATYLVVAVLFFQAGERF